MELLTLLGVSITAPKAFVDVARELVETLGAIPINELVDRRLQFPWPEGGEIVVERFVCDAGGADCQVIITNDQKRLSVVGSVAKFRDGLLHSFRFDCFLGGIGIGEIDSSTFYEYNPRSTLSGGDSFVDRKGRRFILRRR